MKFAKYYLHYVLYGRLINTILKRRRSIEAKQRASCIVAILIPPYSNRQDSRRLGIEHTAKNTVQYKINIRTLVNTPKN